VRYESYLTFYESHEITTFTSIWKANIPKISEIRGVYQWTGQIRGIRVKYLAPTHYMSVAPAGNLFIVSSLTGAAEYPWI
jgi:hypothetical protein